MAYRACNACSRLRWSALVGLMVAGGVQGFTIDTGNRDLRLRWDTTVKYSAMFRVEGRDDALVSPLVNPANVNIDDGNRNFDKGMVSNRFDVLTEVDAGWRGWLKGRVSAVAWYDQVYNANTDNDSPGTYNAVSVPFTRFPDDTEELMGRRVELRDALLQIDVDLWQRPLTVRVGRHALLWGESLFFPDNGLAQAMAPLDAIKATSVPNTPARELILPVGQVSAVFQPIDVVTLEGFYQFEWDPTLLPPPGSYFSPVDFLPIVGGESLLVPAPPPAPPGTLLKLVRRGDQEASDSGQFGVALRYYSERLDTDFGLYFVRHHQRTPPNFYLLASLLPLGPGGALVPVPTGYQPVYAEDIDVIGASFSTTLWGTNIAGEVTWWQDAPLVSAPAINGIPGLRPFDNDDNPGYAVSDQLHAQLSFIRTLTETALYDGGSIVGEIAMQDVTDITANAAMRDPARNRTAIGFRVLFEPSWFNAAPGMDVTGRIGLGYNFKGRSLVAPVFNGTGATDGGDLTLGVKFDLRRTWFFGVNYTAFFGPSDADEINNFLDRDFVSLFVNRTF